MNRRRNPAPACVTVSEVRVRVLLPDHTRLAEARAVANRARSGRAAWENLAAAGFIPMDWVGDPRRRFRGPASRDTLDHPSSARAAALFAADARGVATAEALAREAVARVARWDVPRDPREKAVEWRVSASRMRSSWRAYRVRSVLRKILGYAQLNDEPYGRAVYPEEQAVNDLVLRDGYDELARNGFVVPYDPSYAPAAEERPFAEGRRFADVPNPFAPLVDLWCTGYELLGEGMTSLQMLMPEPSRGTTR